jgi:beta-lactamase class A
VIALFAFAGGAFPLSSGLAQTLPEIERESVAFHRLTSPYLECPGVMNADLRLVQARDAAVDYIGEAQKEDSTLTVSVYARDLNNGPWIGINEREPFAPASLSKVPIMIYLLSQAEGDPSSLQGEVVFPGPDSMSEVDNMEGVPEEMRLQAGQSYTYWDLLFRMIAYSDNFAKELLMTDVDPEDVNYLMSAIGAQENLIDGEYYITPKNYSALFRALYNASFLGRPMSENALSILSESRFRQAMRRYIPEEVTIASKFGHFQVGGNAGGEIQLHECGIIYQPGAPYLLCIMTKSNQASTDRLADVIADLSRIVWEVKGGAEAVRPASTPCPADYGR